MLVSQTKTNIGELFSNKEWIFEQKYDGIRCIVVKNKDQVRLLSRNRYDYTPFFPELLEAFKKQKGSFVVDGEIVADNFLNLTKRLHRKNPSKKMDTVASIKLFDIINDNGKIMKRTSLLERKIVLKESIRFNNIIEYTPPLTELNNNRLKRFKKMGWEGVIAKKLSATYDSSRSKDTIKFVNFKTKLLTICGFKNSNINKGMLSCLVLGKGLHTLNYAGRVSVGIPWSEQRSLKGKLSNLIRKTPPIDIPKRKRNGIIWVQPKWKVRVKFLMKTEKGLLRLPRLKVSKNKTMTLHHRSANTK